ncbi:Ribosome biogenesis protein [Wickerhamomyces ciferrii]|uniref:Ribosome biogenesis protein NSA1 n=1 Tax=Wickerhamomyces ciferrii (strain ATCC 14091 / BCRC 22168 / CBS 111 / JCM 3599 / NBRC 0793 / NRRL Y-1031 F-60-10) TaxID=1206466 RepID=K0KME2_WICCF|nr:Ribosome biogenesis protein [Wickerhamomyces ciferrii]CCH43367.1 Ribosome biogenesis protein [Wickerhamomyces ciferrii]
MRVLTSDLETGGIGVINILTNKIVFELSRQLRFKKTHSLESLGKKLYVQKFCYFERDGGHYLIAGRKGLTIQIFDVDDNFKLISTKQLMTNIDLGDFFVTMEVMNGEFRACTGLGYCYFLRLTALMSSCFNDFSMSFGLHGSVSFMKFLPQSQSSLVIIGGKDREIAIIDVDSHLTIWKSKTSKKIDKLYQQYMTKEPLWVQDVVITKETDSEVKFIAATRFGKLLFFNTQVSRFPIDEIEISENPIKHLRLLNDTLFIADSFDNVILFDYENQTIMNKFHMKTGALSSLDFIQMDQHQQEEELSRRSESRNQGFLVYSSSHADRCLRLYKIEDGYKSLVHGIRFSNGPSTEICVIEKNIIPDVLKESQSQIVNQNKRMRL